MGLIVPIAACCFLGCSTTSNNGTSISSPSQPNARKELTQAKSMYEDGQYYEVVFKLQQLINKDPRSSQAIEARYFLGMTYTKLESHLDAIDLFNTYLRLAPNGTYTEEARSHIQTLAKIHEDLFPSTLKIKQDIAEARKALVDEPDSAKLNAHLADLLWKQGNYEESGRLYYALAQNHPNFKRDITLNNRIEFGTGQSYVILTPDEIRRREIERNPLNIYNTTSFRTGRDRITRTFRNYVVTGQVINRSNKTLNAVEVHSTVYGFGHTVFDTGVFRIGTLRPGDVRAFSLRFRNFENLGNIDSYECFTTYQE